jgi:hypothetical protein
VSRTSNADELSIAAGIAPGWPDTGPVIELKLLSSIRNAPRTGRRLYLVFGGFPGSLRTDRVRNRWKGHHRADASSRSHEARRRQVFGRHEPVRTRAPAARVGGCASFYRSRRTLRARRLQGAPPNRMERPPSWWFDRRPYDAPRPHRSVIDPREGTRAPLPLHLRRCPSHSQQ